MLKKFRRKATKAQKAMIGCMAVAYAGLIGFLFWEIPGALDTIRENTLSEWVWDLPLPFVLSISGLFFLTAAVMAWAGGHFIEGYFRRRQIERGEWKEEPTESE